MHQNELTSGALKYKLGYTYNTCATTQELNEWTQEERRSICGYQYLHWNKTGKMAGSQLKLQQADNNEDPLVFIGELVPKQQENTLQ